MSGSRPTGGNTYDNWRAITESDFVTLFIKTWFAFVATMRVLHPLHLTDRSLSGDGKYLLKYKDNFPAEYFPLMNYDSIKDDFYRIYRDGMKIVSEKYTDFFLKDFFDVNQQFEWESSERLGGNETSDEIIKLSIKKSKNDCVRCILICTDKEYLAKVGEAYRPITVEVNYQPIFQQIIEGIKTGEISASETLVQSVFYSNLVAYTLNALIAKIAETQETLPTKGNKKFFGIFTQLSAFCNRVLQSLETSCTDPSISNDTKLLCQIPYSNFVYRYEDGDSPKEADQLSCYLWFVSFAYRLRNALFHEIIDPLDEEWQQIFKSAYLVLKQIVDGNIQYLQEKDAVAEAEAEVLASV